MFPSYLAKLVWHTEVLRNGPCEMPMEAHMICGGISSRSERLPIFHCAPDLIAHMLIMSG